MSLGPVRIVVLGTYLLELHVGETLMNSNWLLWRQHRSDSSEACWVTSPTCLDHTRKMLSYEDDCSLFSLQKKKNVLQQN